MIRANTPYTHKTTKGVVFSTCTLSQTTSSAVQFDHLSGCILYLVYFRRGSTVLLYRDTHIYSVYCIYEYVEPKSVGAMPKAEKEVQKKDTRRKTVQGLAVKTGKKYRKQEVIEKKKDRRRKTEQALAVKSKKTTKTRSNRKKKKKREILKKTGKKNGEKRWRNESTS